MNRRRFLSNTALGLGTLASGAGVVTAAESPARPAAAAGGEALVDTHVYIGRWPFRRLRGDEVPDLVQTLRKHNVRSAWVGSFDALLHRDIAAVNLRLAEECARQRDVQFIPFGAINPTLPDWEEDLRRCHEVHRMPGVRLHPDFHGYALNDPRCERLLDLATQRRLIVQVSIGMDDSRLQLPLAMVKPADPEPLVELLPRLPGARVVLLNFWRTYRGNRLLLTRLAGLPPVAFDIATVEIMAGIEELLRAQPNLRLVFGSYAPFYNFGSAERKLHESILTAEQLSAIRHNTATSLLGRA